MIVAGRILNFKDQSFEVKSVSLSRKELESCILRGMGLEGDSSASLRFGYSGGEVVAVQVTTAKTVEEKSGACSEPF